MAYRVAVNIADVVFPENEKESLLSRIGSMDVRAVQALEIYMTSLHQREVEAEADLEAFDRIKHLADAPPSVDAELGRLVRENHLLRQLLDAKNDRYNRLNRGVFIGLVIGFPIYQSYFWLWALVVGLCFMSEVARDAKGLPSLFRPFFGTKDELRKGGYYLDSRKP